MKFNKWVVIFLLVLLGMLFVSWEFFVTSRMSLSVNVIYPEGISDDVGFEMRIYSADFESEMMVYPEKDPINYSNMPFGDYFFELQLDDRLIVKEFHNFTSVFSIQRTKETVTLDISELATITAVNYKIVDPYLTIKWTGKYMGAYKPTEYLVYLNETEKILSVNYLEMDVLKELLEGKEKVAVTIIPLTQDGEEILRFNYEIPVRMERVNLDIPDGFNIYEMSINIQEKPIPIDPYDPSVRFPVIDLPETSIPYEIYYYEDRIWKSELTLSESIEQIKLPDIPKATVSAVNLEQSTVTLHLNVTREEEFLYNHFKYFEIHSDTINSTATEIFTYHNDHTVLSIIPLFEPDIQGEETSFTIPGPPIPRLHTTMFDEDMTFKPTIKIFSDSFLSLTGMVKIDNDKEFLIPEFTSEYTFETDFQMDEVHLIEVSLKDVYGQKAEHSKWVSSSVPETTFFKRCEMNADQMLFVEWDPLLIYSEIELIVTDDYNIKRFYPEESNLQTDLSGTLLSEPIRVIVKGYLDGEAYTAAVIEGVRSD